MWFYRTPRSNLGKNQSFGFLLCWFWKLRAVVLKVVMRQWRRLFPMSVCNLTLRKLCFHFLSHWMGYDRDDRFPFDLEPNWIPFGSKLKGKLSPRSYPIQCERKWKYSFLCVTLRISLSPGSQCNSKYIFANKSGFTVMKKYMILFNHSDFFKLISNDTVEISVRLREKRQ